MWPMGVSSPGHASRADAEQVALRTSLRAGVTPQIWEHGSG